MAWRGVAQALVAVVVVALGGCAAHNSPEPSTPRPGEKAVIQVETDLPGAFVELGPVGPGGSSRRVASCQSPCTLTVPPGRWHLRATSPGERVEQDVVAMGGEQRIVVEGTNHVARDLGLGVAVLGVGVAGYGIVSWVRRGDDCQRTIPLEGEPPRSDPDCSDRNVLVGTMVVPGIAAAIVGAIVFDRSGASVELGPPAPAGSDQRRRSGAPVRVLVGNQPALQVQF